MSVPLNTIWPDVGSRNLVSRLKQVVLPAPLGPINAWMEPRRTRRFTPLTAVNPLNSFVRPRVSRIVSPRIMSPSVLCLSLCFSFGSMRFWRMPRGSAGGVCWVIALLLLRFCSSAGAFPAVYCVLHNGDADLPCIKRTRLIVALMMQRNHRDLHLVSGFVFVRTGGRAFSFEVDEVVVEVYAGRVVPNPTPLTIGASEDKNRRSARIISLARSAIINVGEFVLPEVIVGMTEASTTRNPLTPITRNRPSTTAAGSLFVPIRHVPTG